MFFLLWFSVHFELSLLYKQGVMYKSFIIYGSLYRYCHSFCVYKGEDFQTLPNHLLSSYFFRYSYITPLTVRVDCISLTHPSEGVLVVWIGITTPFSRGTFFTNVNPDLLLLDVFTSFLPTSLRTTFVSIVLEWNIEIFIF